MSVFSSLLPSLNTVGSMAIFGTTFSDLPAFFICLAAALILALPLAFSYTLRNKRYSKSFVLALFALPAAVATVLLLVNRDWGAAITLAGVFALIRFRSIPATAKEIVNIFMAMIIGVAIASAYSSSDSFIVAIVFSLAASVINVVFSFTHLGEGKRVDKTLRITIPESLDYTEVFDDLFAQYTTAHELVRVKTTNMGSLFQLTYEITLKDEKEERAFLNDLRTRNGNLDIICAKTVENYEKL